MAESLTLYSVIVPARDEEESLPGTIREIHQELSAADIPHEIVIVDDGSKDPDVDLAPGAESRNPRPFPGSKSRAEWVRTGDHLRTKQLAGRRCVVIMMADSSDSPADAVKYWRLLNQGYECVFGSRFVRGSRVVDYPRVKLFVNRLANLFVEVITAVRYGNDTTNAFQSSYRRNVIDGCRPFLAAHFNLTVELPLKSIVRGFTWTTTPISWRNRTQGTTKLRIKEMGSRYFFICMYVWLEKYFSRGDYKRR